MMETMPEETKDLVKQQLEGARRLAVPMLSDYIWWISAGKYEWVYLSNRLEKFIDLKKEEKDEVWIGIVDEFDQKLKAIQGITETEVE